MRQFWKKGLSAFIAMAVILTTCVYAAGFSVPEDAEGSVYETAARMLLSLGIMQPAEDGAFAGDIPVSRAEFAQIVVRLMGLSTITHDKSGKSVEVIDDRWEGSGITSAVMIQQAQFRDVPLDHWAYDFIEVVARMSFMSGDPDGNFMPDERIMYQDALVVLLKVMGYGPFAEYGGGYPQGYLSLAAKNGIRVSTSPTAAITKGQLANVIYDCFDVDLQVQVGFGEEKSFEKRKDCTLLSEYLGIEQTRGIVTGTELSGLFAPGGKSKAGFVKIDNLDYQINDLDPEGLLGKRLTCYYREDEGIRTLAYFECAAQDNAEWSFQAGDLIKVENSQMTFDAEAHEKKMSFSPDIPVIFNEVYLDVARNVTFETYRDFAGSFRFLDQDGDGKTDVIFVKSYRTYLVRNVDTSGMRVYVQDVTKAGSVQVETGDDGRQSYLPLELEDSNLICQIYKDGKEATIANITPNAVLSVAASENTVSDVVQRIYISAKTVKGKLNLLREETATVGETAYPVLPNLSAAFRVGMTGTFYLDVFGNLAGFSESEQDYDYAYLTNVSLEGALSKTLYLRMFTKRREKVESFTISDKIPVISGESEVTAKSDGSVEYSSKSTRPEELLTLLSKADDTAHTVTAKRQLVAYKADEENEITALCLARVYRDWDISNAHVIPQSHPVGILSTVTNADGTDGPGVSKARTTSRTQFPQFVPSGNAIFFDLQDQSSVNWGIKTRDMLKDRVEYERVSAYNLGAANVAGIVLLEPPDDFIIGSSGGELPNTTRYDQLHPMVISELGVGLNETGDEVYRIKGFKNGSEQNYTLEVSRGGEKGKSMRVGDVWMMEANNEGVVTNAEQLLSSQQDWQNAASYRKVAPNAANADECDTALGRIREVGENSLLIAVESNNHPWYTNHKLWTARINQWGDGATKVTEYDVKNKTVTQKLASDITTDDLVFTYCTYNVMHAIMLIRNYE